MPKKNTHTPPPTRDPTITRSPSSASTLGEQIAHISDTVLVTPGQEKATMSDRYILVSPIPGPIIVEQLLNGNSHNITEFRRKFTKDHPTQDFP